MCATTGLLLYVWHPNRAPDQTNSTPLNRSPSLFYQKGIVIVAVVNLCIDIGVWELLVMMLIEKERKRRCWFRVLCKNMCEYECAMGVMWQQWRQEKRGRFTLTPVSRHSAPHHTHPLTHKHFLRDLFLALLPTLLLGYTYSLATIITKSGAMA